MHPLASSYCTALQRKLQQEWRAWWTPCEHGALRDRSVRDPLIFSSIMIHRARAAKQPFAFYFGDLRKAFDLISRDRVLETVRS